MKRVPAGLPQTTHKEIDHRATLLNAITVYQQIISN